MSLDATYDYSDEQEGGEIAEIAAAADMIHHLFACCCLVSGVTPTDDAYLQLRVLQLRANANFEFVQRSPEEMLSWLQQELANLLIGDQVNRKNSP